MGGAGFGIGPGSAGGAGFGIGPSSAGGAEFAEDSPLDHLLYRGAGTEWGDRFCAGDGNELAGGGVAFFQERGLVWMGREGAYGDDWLAFAHLVIAVAFIGPLRDPVRNKWVIEFGMIACVLVFPLAFVAGAVRGIPIFWRLIDCSFGVVGLVPLSLCYRRIGILEEIKKACCLSRLLARFTYLVFATIGTVHQVWVTG